MSSNHRLRVTAATWLLCAAAVVHAAPWQPDTVVTGQDAGYGAYDGIGFGYEVEMSAEWLAVGALYGFCASPAGVVNGGSVLMYRYDKVTGQYTYTQQICGNRVGRAIAIWNDWMILGSPYVDTTPGDSLAHGRVQFFRYEAATQQWVMKQSFDGAIDSLMGWSVAIEGGVAAAGESGYNDDRGRVRTWRLDAMGTSWISEGYINGVTPGSHGAQPDEAFGAAVALDIRNCRAPTCADALDALAIVSRSRLWTIERTATGWGAWSGLEPAAGTSNGWGDVALNESVAVAVAQIFADTPNKPCPTDIWVTETRVLRRVPRSIELRDVGFACRGLIGVGPVQQFIDDLAVQTKGGEFFFSIGDYPASRIGVASTWNLTTSNAIVATDFVADPDRTSAIYAETGNNFFNPIFTGDYFGRSHAVQPRRMAVGAPFYNAFPGAIGSGYVALFKR